MNATRPSRFTYPRYNTANTTVRVVQSAVPRLATIAEHSSKWTTRTCATKDHFLDQVSATLGVNRDVTRKTLQFGITLGLFEEHEPSATDRALGHKAQMSIYPASGTGFPELPWVRLTTSGTTFLSCPDLPAAIAHQLLRIHTKGGVTRHGTTTLIRPAIAALEFLGTTFDEWMSTEEYAFFCAAVGKERGWNSQRRSMQTWRERGAHMADLMTRIWDHEVNAQARSAIMDAVNEALSAGDSEDVISHMVGRLVPGVRKEVHHTVLQALVDARAQGPVPFATEVRSQVCQRTYDTCNDMNKCFLSLLADAELIERQDRGTTARWRITDFGREALATAPARPERTPAGALAKLRSTAAFGFAARTHTRQTRLSNFVTELRTGDHPEMVDDLVWDRWRGANQAARYEWAAVTATLSCVDTAADWDPTEGLRTVLSFDLEPLSPAPGGAGDAIVLTREGLTIIVEATGVEGDKQIGQELEPVARHLREYMEHDSDTVVLFVAPQVSERLVAHWLGATAFEIPGRTAALVPVSEHQLRSLARTNSDLVGLCRQIAADTVTVVDEALATHGRHFALPAARSLLARIEELVGTGPS